MADRHGRAAVLVVLGLATLGAVAGWLARDGNDEPEGPDRPAAERFLAAWERSREATFRMEADFLRTGSSGAQLADDLLIVQRPPDRLTVDGDGATGLVDGQRIGCAARPDGRLRCNQAEAGVTYDEEVANQLETLSSYVAGDSLLYRVRDEGACFQLDLARDIPAPPLGTLATYCFDEEIGALTLTRIERPEAVDETTAVALTGTVTDADLAPPSHAL
jgi:hypothetical protein